MLERSPGICIYNPVMTENKTPVPIYWLAGRQTASTVAVGQKSIWTNDTYSSI